MLEECIIQLQQSLVLSRFNLYHGFIAAARHSGSGAFRAGVHSFLNHMPWAWKNAPAYTAGNMVMLR